MRWLGLVVRVPDARIVSGKVRWHGVTAGWTGLIEGGAAALAEPVIVRVLELTLGTLQSRPSSAPLEAARRARPEGRRISHDMPRQSACPMRRHRAARFS